MHDRDGYWLEPFEFDIALDPGFDPRNEMMWHAGKYVRKDSVSTEELRESLETHKIWLDDGVSVCYNIRAIKEIKDILKERG